MSFEYNKRARQEIVDKIIKNSNIKSIPDWAKKMREIMLARAGRVQVDKNQISDQEEERLHKSVKDNYKGYLYDYINDGRELGRGIVQLAGEVVGKNFSDLDQLLYPHYYTLDSNSAEEKQAENIISQVQLQQAQCYQKEIYNQNIVKEFGYKIIENKHEATYTKGDTNTFKMVKTMQIKALEDNIHRIDHFDYYKCVRDDDRVEIDYPGDVFNIDRKKHFASDDNSVSIIFHKPLMREQEVTVQLSYFYRNVLDRDLGFHYSWTLHPTEKLILEVTPPEPNINCQAKYRVHRFKGCPLGVEEELERHSREVSLEKDSMTYKLTIKEPELLTTCGLYWGREYW